MRLEFSLTSKRGHRRTLVAEAAPGASVRSVLADRLDEGDVVFDGSRPVDLERPVAQGGLRSGADLSVGYPGEDRPWPLDGPALAVVGGAAAATLVPLQPGTVTIGRGSIRWRSYGKKNAMTRGWREFAQRMELALR